MDIYVYIDIQIYNVCIYIYNWIILNHKNNIIFPFATWKNFEGIVLCEISQPEKYESCMLSFIGRIYKIEEINEYNKAKKLKHMKTV